MIVRSMSVRAGLMAFLQNCVAALAVMTLANSAIPDDREESKVGDSEERRETARLIQAELPRWKVAMGERAADLKLNANSVLRWTNPATETTSERYCMSLIKAEGLFQRHNPSKARHPWKRGPQAASD
jgi:hypothetical protein